MAFQVDLFLQQIGGVGELWEGWLQGWGSDVGEAFVDALTLTLSTHWSLPVPRGLRLLTLSETPHGKVVGGGLRYWPTQLMQTTDPRSELANKALPKTFGKSSQHWVPTLLIHSE